MTDEANTGGGAPWVDHDVQQRIAWRDGDIVISVPAKSGTTWTMNIVHQLRSGGDPDFADIYAEVPWLSIVDRPGRTTEELVARYDAMPAQPRRAFKTHSAPPRVPFHRSGSGVDVQYVVVLRDPEEALVSFRVFLGRHTDAWFRLWNVSPDELWRPDFATFFSEVVEPRGLLSMFYGFMAAWWPLRHEPNVLLLHFSDLKRDHAGSIRRIADFLGFAPTEEQWPTILELTSFPWMKAHEEKFEGHTMADVPVLERGAMIRRGMVGAAREDGMSEAIAARMRAFGREALPDATALAWLYGGGPLP